MSEILNENYCDAFIPSDILTKLEAGAFRALCQHLQERSDEVQNIDLMTLSGFCRNCLAKWLVVEARKLSDEMKEDEKNDASVSHKKRVMQALDALGYNEAAEKVYGCAYKEWKQRHMKKVTDEKMNLFKESSYLHSVHDKSLLEVRAVKPTALTETMNLSQNEGEKQNSSFTSTNPNLQSNVCCNDVENVAQSEINESKAKMKSAFPTLPAFALNKDIIHINIGILTVSDRAFKNEYESGDLSGPAIKESINVILDQLNSNNQSTTTVHTSFVKEAIVPDDAPTIAKMLQSWCKRNKDDELNCNLIFTTGGTGFSPRDVTPEATRSILDRECHDLMSFVNMECARSGEQHYAVLSRGTAGISHKTIIANLPGNPNGVKESMKFIFPLLLHAVNDLNEE